METGKIENRVRRIRDAGNIVAMHAVVRGDGGAVEVGDWNGIVGGDGSAVEVCDSGNSVVAGDGNSVVAGDGNSVVAGDGNSVEAVHEAIVGRRHGVVGVHASRMI